MSTLHIKIAPSILSADFTKLGDDINSVRSADYLHVDIMDGRFVPNITIGFPVLKSIRKFTDMILDVHLMIESPTRYLSRFAKYGSDIITIHAEAESHENTISAINEIHKYGKKAGLSIRPGTSIDAVLPYMEMLDLVLIMTVEPGFGGQKFIPETLTKIRSLRDLVNSRKLDCEIEVDGGINKETAKLCVDAGANVLVAGNDVFGATDRAARIKELRG